MEKELIEISKRIKQLRVARHVSQIELAQAIGVSQTHMSNIEHGKTVVTLSRLMMIAKVLGSKMGYFFGENDTSKEETETHKVDISDLAAIVKAVRLVDAGKAVV